MQAKTPSSLQTFPRWQVDVAGQTILPRDTKFLVLVNRQLQCWWNSFQEVGNLDTPKYVKNTLKKELPDNSKNRQNLTILSIFLQNLRNWKWWRCCQDSWVSGVDECCWKLSLLHSWLMNHQLSSHSPVFSVNKNCVSSCEC